VDLFLYDLKLMDDERHRRFTGVSNAPVLRNLRRLSELGHRIRLRVPVIPDVNDDEENLRAVAAFAAELPHLEGADLLPYHHIGVDKYERLDRTYQLPDSRSPSEERLGLVARFLEGNGLAVGPGPGP
jgi:pyruvate formate lyase activating enzyme